MKLKKYLLGLIGILFLTVIACNNDNLKNPELSDSDLTVYFWGEGDNVTGIAWEGYDVLIGESQTIKLQISPKADTNVKWVDDTTGDILSETLEYTFAPTQEEQKRVNFVATRPSGHEVVIVFNFRGNLDGFTSKINQWQSVLIPEGTQTGTFTAEFDMIPSKDNMDGVVGILDGIATTYSNNSCIVRLNGSGKIDAYNDTGYAAENELVYHAGMTYHVKMDVDAVNRSYDIYVTEQGGSEVVIGTGFKFRRKITHLDYWSMVAGNYNIDDPGTHRVLNMQFTVHTQNEAPVFTPVEDLVMNEGQTVEVEIEAIDPLGGNIKLEATSLPRFTTFVDKGFGKGLVTFSPYDNCDGCDLGIYDIKITATNNKESTDLDFTVEVIDPNAGIKLAVDLADATVWSTGEVVSDYINLFGGGIGDVGVSGAAADVVGVMPFALPEVPAGKKISTAYLRIYITANNAWVDVNYDVYAINAARVTSEVLASDYYIGDYNGDTNATAIQEAYYAKGIPANPGATDPPVEVNMDDTAAKNLAVFMNNQYKNGASAGQFMFVRISANRSMPTWAHTQYKSGDTDVADTAPILIVTLEDE